MIDTEIGHVLCPICKSPRVRMFKEQRENMKVKYKCNDCGAQWSFDDEV